MSSPVPGAVPSASIPVDERPKANPQGRLGFNGQLHEPGDCWQFLGNGYRVYNPVLMRFHSPDSLSPFGEGGINAYAYCAGDPVNAVDPSGHWSFHAFAASLATYKLKTSLVTPVLVATAASLAAVGLAVATPNDTQRGFAIAGAVIAAAGALMGGALCRKSEPQAAGEAEGAEGAEGGLAASANQYVLKGQQWLNQHNASLGYITHIARITRINRITYTQQNAGDGAVVRAPDDAGHSRAASAECDKTSRYAATVAAAAAAGAAAAADVGITPGKYQVRPRVVGNGAEIH